LLAACHFSNLLLGGFQWNTNVWGPTTATADRSPFDPSSPLHRLHVPKNHNRLGGIVWKFIDDGN
jgi:hypothetical protein